MRRSQHENDDSVAEAVTARYREKRKGSRRAEQTVYAVEFLVAEEPELCSCLSKIEL